MIHPVLALLLWLITGLTVSPVQGQFPAIANTIFGSESLLPGVKNILGGILAADNIHANCLQKVLCNEFADEVVKVAAEVDPVKRTIVHIPKVVKPRGRLRFIGDFFVNGLKRLSRKLGLNPPRINRRQGLVGGAGIVNTLSSMASSAISGIPLKSMVQ